MRSHNGHSANPAWRVASQLSRAVPSKCCPNLLWTAGQRPVRLITASAERSGSVFCMAPNSVPVAYLDTNIVRDKVESRRVATTLPSLMTTLTRWNQGDVNLVTSKTMKQE